MGNEMIFSLNWTSIVSSW